MDKLKNISFKLPTIQIPSNKEMIRISEEWWSNTHEDISVLSWNDALKSVSASFQLIDLNSVNIFIQIETRVFDKRLPVFIHDRDVAESLGNFKTRSEARKQAIIKANQIYNNR